MNELRETEEVLGNCNHCGKKRLIEVEYVFVSGEWEQEGQQICNECKER